MQLPAGDGEGIADDTGPHIITDYEPVAPVQRRVVFERSIPECLPMLR
jgi:hypothetical protein